MYSAGVWDDLPKMQIQISRISMSYDMSFPPLESCLGYPCFFHYALSALHSHETGWSITSEDFFFLKNKILKHIKWGPCPCYISVTLEKGWGGIKGLEKLFIKLQTTFSRHWRWRGIPPKHHFSRRPAIRLAASLRCSISRLLLRTRSVLEANVLSL